MAQPQGHEHARGPSELDLDHYLDQDYNNDVLDAYDSYNSDHASSAAAPAALQTPDTLGASSLGPHTGPGTSPSAATAEQYHDSQLPSDRAAATAAATASAPAHHDHLDHQGQGLEQPLPQPYRPEVAPAHQQILPPRPPPEPLQSPRTTRSHSLAASLASLGSQSSIRRKPLSPTASPLAIRFSTTSGTGAGANSYHMPPRDPEQPDSGYYSLNSPDLYELGSKAQKPISEASLPQPPQEGQISDQE